LLAVGGVFARNEYLDHGLKVRTIAVERGSISTFVSAPGNVINRDELTISSPIAGQLIKLHAAEGDTIEKGRLLASFDDRENSILLDKARASLTFAEQNLAEAKRNLERIRQIFEIGGEPRNAVDAAELQVKENQKELLFAKAELHQTQFQRTQLQITAPSAGTLTAAQARAGVWIKPGDPLFKLAPAGVREIEVRLDAADSAAAVLGKTVSVTSDAFAGQSWQEKITWVAPITSKDSTTNSLSVRISLGSDAPPLVLGQQVDVKISTASRDEILKVPSGAIIAMEGAPMVAVAEDSSVRLIPVELGIGDLTHTEITRGLKDGQQIILPEGKPLREGDKIALDTNRTTQ
jgi:RND family efflux transporter MFP subunit